MSVHSPTGCVMYMLDTIAQTPDELETMARQWLDQEACVVVFLNPNNPSQAIVQLRGLDLLELPETTEGSGRDPLSRGASQRRG